MVPTIDCPPKALSDLPVFDMRAAKPRSKNSHESDDPLEADLDDNEGPQRRGFPTRCNEVAVEAYRERSASASLALACTISISLDMPRAAPSPTASRGRDSFPLLRYLARKNSLIIDDEGERAALIVVAERFRSDLLEATADVMSTSHQDLDRGELYGKEADDDGEIKPSYGFARKEKIDENSGLEVPGRLIQKRSNRLVWHAIATWAGKRSERRELHSGKSIPYDQIDQVVWEYGPESITIEPREHKLPEIGDDGKLREVKRIVQWRILKQRIVAKFPAGQSVWSLTLSEPVDADLEPKTEWRLIKQTISDRVDNDWGSSVRDDRIDAALRLRVLERCLGADLFGALVEACLHGAEVSDVGIGDSRQRPAAGALLLLTGLRRAATIYAEIERAERSGGRVDPAWWAGIGHSDAIIMIGGVFHASAANDNMGTARHAA